MKKLSLLNIDVTLLIILTGLLLLFISSKPRTSKVSEDHNQVNKRNLVYAQNFIKKVGKEDAYVFSFRVGGRLITDTIKLGEQRLFLGVNTYVKDVFSGFLVVLYPDSFCIYNIGI